MMELPSGKKFSFLTRYKSVTDDIIAVAYTALV